MAKKLKGFQKRALMYGADADVAQKLPVAWPPPDEVGEALFDAGLPAGEGLATLEQMLLQVHPEKETGAAPPAAPTTIRLAKDGPKELMEQVNGGDQSPQVVNALLGAVNHQAVFVNDGDKLDIPATLEALDYAVKHGQSPRRVHGKPTKSLHKALSTTQYNNPLTGKPLNPGDLWLNVSPDRRLMVAWCIVKGYLPRSIPEHLARAEAGQDNLTGTMFEEFLVEWQETEADETDPALMEAKLRHMGKSKQSSEDRVVHSDHGDDSDDWAFIDKLRGSDDFDLKMWIGQFDSLNKREATHRRNMAIYEQQQAAHGLDVPVSISNGLDGEREQINQIIEERREIVRRIKQRGQVLNKKRVSVDDGIESALRQRLRLLELRKARQGINTDPAVLIEIEDIEQRLRANQTQVGVIGDHTTIKGGIHFS